MKHTLRTLALHVKSCPGASADDKAEAKAVLAPRRSAKPKSRRPAKVAREARKLTKAEARRIVYGGVRTRDAGRCTVTDPFGRRCASAGTEIDHQWGRGREESVDSCRQVCAHHHRQKTDSEPNRTWWLVDFRSFAERNGYVGQVEKAERAISLELAQHPQHPESP